MCQIRAEDNFINCGDNVLRSKETSVNYRHQSKHLVTKTSPHKDNTGSWIEPCAIFISASMTSSMSLKTLSIPFIPTLNTGPWYLTSHFLPVMCTYYDNENYVPLYIPFLLTSSKSTFLGGGVSTQSISEPSVQCTMNNELYNEQSTVLYCTVLYWTVQWALCHWLLL